MRGIAGEAIGPEVVVGIDDLVATHHASAVSGTGPGEELLERCFHRCMEWVTAIAGLVGSGVVEELERVWAVPDERRETDDLVVGFEDPSADAAAGRPSEDQRHG